MGFGYLFSQKFHSKNVNEFYYFFSLKTNLSKQFYTKFTGNFDLIMVGG